MIEWAGVDGYPLLEWAGVDGYLILESAGVDGYPVIESAGVDGYPLLESAVLDGKTGLIVDGEDKDQVKQALVSLLNNKHDSLCFHPKLIRKPWFHITSN